MDTLEELKKQKSKMSAVRNLFIAEDYERAIDLLKEIIEFDPNALSAFLLLAHAYKQINDPKLEEVNLLKAKALEPGNPTIAGMLGLNLYNQKRYDEALPYLEMLYKNQPKDTALAIILYFTLAIHLDRKNEGLKVLELANEESDDINIDIQLAKHYIRYKKDYELAIQILSETLETKETIEVLITIAEAYSYNGNYKKAIDYLRKALEKNPERDDLWRSISQNYLKLNKFHEALEASEYALAIDPNNIKNLQRKGMALVFLEDYEGYLINSQKYIDKLLSADENENYMGSFVALEFALRFLAYIELGKPNVALEEIEKGKKLAPGQRILYSSEIEWLIKDKRANEALNKLMEIKESSVYKDLIPLHYQVLHALNREKDAWNLIKNNFEPDFDNQLENLIDQAIHLYSQGYIQSAISAMKQLLRKAPESNRIKTDLAYILIGEEDYSEAEKLLKEVIQFKDDEVYYQIAICNLAYQYNVLGKYPEAYNLISKIIYKEIKKQDSTMRINFWYNNNMLTERDPHPGRAITVSDAAHICAIASALAIDKIDKARIILQKYSENQNNESLFLLTKACFEIKDGNLEGAWQSAIKCQETVVLKQDKGIIAEMLEDLKDQLT